MDLFSFEKFLDSEKDLCRVYRLCQIIRDLFPDRLLHEVFLFGFCYHHDRSCRSFRFDFDESIEPTHAGHHLIKKDKVGGGLVMQGNGISSIGGSPDAIATLLKEHNVWGQQVNFVVNPEDVTFNHSFAFFSLTNKVNYCNTGHKIFLRAESFRIFVV